jgi:cytochrome c553
MRASTILLCLVLGACGDDDEGVITADANGDAPDGAAGPDSSLTAQQQRGRYLVDNVALCADCHGARLPDGSPDPAGYLAGWSCFVDSDAADGLGCLSSRNLTNHENGLANRSDQEIKDMFQHGMRPNDVLLYPVMPYWLFGNITADDADAIVAYLRTVPGNANMPAANEAPWLDATRPVAAVPTFDMALVPPSSDASTENGRYLTANVGTCMLCHTQDDNQPIATYPIDDSKLFAGGRVFAIGGPFGNVETWNLTQHATGLAGWTAPQIVTVLKTGVAPDGTMVCPPMPGGTAFAGLSDADAMDIANYILSLPGENNMITADCTPP